MEWPLLADLSPDDVRQLLTIARRRTFSRGEVVFHREDLADSRLLDESRTTLDALTDILGLGSIYEFQRN